ncbi:hypothetical protein BOTBODRAFT_548277 [Botryobasidium botryosum FD-172 SS1]|uniref:RRM domain-containing protein n=1 Tax=Botryobasidium botryosum (strain FD-172 SS1) TaxID=930990 RepID=A0A067MQN2_BOTB1|nr:hypothetical protein BOTBODRAFT_548277 [Botryobasidium botryosum FD-172 SS1]
MIINYHALHALAFSFRPRRRRRRRRGRGRPPLYARSLTQILMANTIGIPAVGVTCKPLKTAPFTNSELHQAFGSCGTIVAIYRGTSRDLRPHVIVEFRNPGEAMAASRVVHEDWNISVLRPHNPIYSTYARSKETSSMLMPTPVAPTLASSSNALATPSPTPVVLSSCPATFPPAFATAANANAKPPSTGTHFRDIQRPGPFPAGSSSIAAPAATSYINPHK